MSALRVAHGGRAPLGALADDGLDVLVLDGSTLLDERRDEAIATAVGRGVVVVVRVDEPAAGADAVRALLAARHLDATVAHVEGDDLVPRLSEVRPFLGPLPAAPSRARAELGAWGIVEALDRGARVVVVGDVSPASVVVGPAAWHHGWTRQDWDELAGAVVAGQLLTGGTGCTGANYPFLAEVPETGEPGPPVVEVHADGSSVVTKRAGTGGVVTTGTVIAQLLDGGRGLEHADPDATVRRNSVRVEQEGPDRVRVHSVRGLPGPETAVVALEAPGGHRNTVTAVLTGVNLDAKADRVQDALWGHVPGGASAFGSVVVQLRPLDGVQAELRVTVTGAEADTVGAAFRGAAGRAAESCPGVFVLPAADGPSPFALAWPSTVPTDQVQHVAVVGDERVAIAPAPTKPPALQRRMPAVPVREPSARKVAPTVSTHPETISTLLEDLNRRRLTAGAADDDSVHWDSLPMANVPLGRLAGARSGTAGADATIGVWVPDEDAYDWLQWYLSIDRFQGLLPADLEGLELERFELPNVNALSFVILDLLPHGAAASARIDPTARSLGEFVRAQVVDIPAELL